jgi:hypothetical protein
MTVVGIVFTLLLRNEDSGAAYAVAIAVIFLLAGWILLAVGNRLGTRKGIPP